MIVVLDYGLGNLRSVQKALQLLGAPCTVASNLSGAAKLLIPGVGAFGAAMERIEPLRKEITAFAESGKPIMGICLGQQILFDESEELGHHRGLGLVPGKVKYLPKKEGMKIPHMGWSALTYLRSEAVGKGGQEGEQVYFVHSLHTVCDNPEHVVATASYGIDFVAAIQRENVWGAQFHPEKSGEVGLRMLRSFVEC